MFYPQMYFASRKWLQWLLHFHFCRFWTFSFFEKGKEREGKEVDVGRERVGRISFTSPLCYRHSYCCRNKAAEIIAHHQGRDERVFVHEFIWSLIDEEIMQAETEKTRDPKHSMCDITEVLPFTSSTGSPVTVIYSWKLCSRCISSHCD